MPAPPSQILMNYLRAQGVLPSPAWYSTVGTYPADKDNAVGFTDTGGLQHERLASTGKYSETPSVLINIRAANYPTGWNKGKEIEEVLRKVGTHAPDGVGWVGVYVGAEYHTIKNANRTVMLSWVGKEETEDRNLFSLNYRLDVE